MASAKTRLLDPAAATSEVAAPDKGEDSSNAPVPSPGPAKLGWKKVTAFGLGHVLNDLCAACWFSYLLVFLHKVLMFGSFESAMVLLSGQLADAAATPLVGIVSDRSKGLSWGAFYFGRRHLWYTIGTVLVFINFFFLFGRCVACDLTYMSPSASVAYYSIAAALFNVGWAAVQVSHMSLVPELTSDTATRVKLNSVRYSGTVGSNLAVFGMLAVFSMLNSLGREAQFHALAYACLGIGVCTSIIFLLGTEEKRPAVPRKVVVKERQRGASLSFAGHTQRSYQTLAESPSNLHIAAQIPQYSPPAPANPMAEHPISEQPERTRTDSQLDSILLTSPSDVRPGSMQPQHVVLHLGTDEPNGSAQPAGVGSVPSPEDVDYESDAVESMPRSVSSLMPAVGAFDSAHPMSFENTLARELQTLPVKFKSYKCWLNMTEYYIAGMIYMCCQFDQQSLWSFLLDLGCSSFFVHRSASLFSFQPVSS
jgi:hypothetical protein